MTGRPYGRLLDRGLTRKGIAQRCGVSQKLVGERLALLSLGEDLYPKIADGTIPPGPIRTLVELSKIHPLCSAGRSLRSPRWIPGPTAMGPTPGQTSRATRCRS